MMVVVGELVPRFFVAVIHFKEMLLENRLRYTYTPKASNVGVVLY